MKENKVIISVEDLTEEGKGNVKVGLNGSRITILASFGAIIKTLLGLGITKSELDFIYNDSIKTCKKNESDKEDLKKKLNDLVDELFS